MELHGENKYNKQQNNIKGKQNMIEVRHARRDDMKALAVIQVSSWKKGFKNILSKKTIEKYTDLEKCQNMFEKFYDSKSGYFYIAYREENPCADLIWCGHFNFNSNSKRVIEKCGFKYIFSITQKLKLLDNKEVTNLYYCMFKSDYAS